MTFNYFSCNDSKRLYFLIRFGMGLALAFGLASALLWYEHQLFKTAIAGVYLQAWPSEVMMQTLSIEDLRDEPLKSLWYLHVQPPMLDGIRAIFANLSNALDLLSLQYDVDRSLYFSWAILYGFFTFFIFWWISQLTNNWFALGATLFFSLNPSVLLYATLLESTFLSSLFILFFAYTLWKIKVGTPVPVFLPITVFITLFFTRSLFQWQFLLIVIFSLVLMNYPRKKIIQFGLIVGIIIGLYIFKQATIFGISTTSSFIGLNLCNSIQACRGHEINPNVLKSFEQLNAGVLYRAKKITGSENYNHYSHLQLNKEYLNDYRQKLSELSWMNLMIIYYQNLRIYLKPSSNYASDNHLIVSLPKRWLAYYESIFSYPFFPAILLSAIVFWGCNAKRSDYKAALGIAIPIVAIFLISILFESGENMRFKFFIEPVLYIFIVSQIYILLKISIEKFQRTSYFAPS